jgi:integrase
MLVRVFGDKGGRGRNVPLISRTLPEPLVEYRRRRKPKTYLFLSWDLRSGPDRPIAEESVWVACRRARGRDLRHLSPFPFSETRTPSMPRDRGWWARAAGVFEGP